MQHFVVETYHHRTHGETGQAPLARWEAAGFLPCLPASLEKLDLLLLTVPKPRQVHQDGIHLHGLRYIDLTLAAYVGEDVVRYDPRDMAEVRVYHQGRFLCRAICQELADRGVGLKDIIRARTERRWQLRAGLSEREALVEALLAVHRPPPEPDPPPAPTDFIVTKEHRRFVELCDACRRYRYIGVCHGAPGVGKTLSAWQYARWNLVEAPASYYLPSAEIPQEFITERTIVYTPEVANAPRQVERTVQGLRRRVNALALRALQAQDADGPGEAGRVPDLIIVDEADRLKMAGLEQMRALYDKGNLGLIFIGMPGLEKRLARYAQLYSRVGFVHQFRALSTEEMQFILAHKWAQLGLTLAADDFTDAEAVAAIVRITGGNFRLIQRLFTQIERILQINVMRTVTKEVVEAARESLAIGPL